MTGPQDADQTPTWAAPGSTPPAAPPAPPAAPAPPAPDAPSAPQAPQGVEQPAPSSWGAPPSPPSPGPAVPPPYPQPGAGQYGSGQYGPVQDGPPRYGQQQDQQPYPQPQYGQPQYGQPQYGQPGYGPTAWRPPAPRPGIIPLRPLNLGEILDGAFRAVRANPAVMFGLSLAVVAVTVALQAVVTLYVGGLLAGELADWFDDPAFEDAGLGADMSDSLGASGAQVLTMPISALATTALTGLLILSVSRSVIGRKVTIGEVVRSGRVWHVLGFTVLLAVAAVLVVGVLVGIGFLLWQGTGSWGVVVVYGVVATIVLVVGGVWVGVRTLLVPAALMLEERRFWPTVARAWRLTRRSFWRLFGIQLLVGVIVYIVAQIIQFPVVLVLMFALNTTDSLTTTAILVTSVGQVLSLTITTVFSAAVVALLYIDTRMRREGLDIELARAAEQAA